MGGSHPLSGANPSTLLDVYRKYGPPDEDHRKAFALAAASSLAKTPVSLLERLYVSLNRQRIEPIEAPIFILGHWRSGTTHLYNVMSRAAHFGYVSPFQTALPWDFLIIGQLFGPLLARALPEGRYIDNVAVNPDSPQEDEIALANMTATSFYHALYFPRDFNRIFDQGIFFDGLGEDGIADWRQRLEYLYLKLQLAQDGRRLVIKNPAYTGRAALLRRIWPDAKFIHIHRNPYKVFFSMRNFYDKLFRQFALQPWSHVDIDAHILKTYGRMMEAQERDWAAMEAGQGIELSFGSFQADPLGSLEKIYEALDLPGFAGAEPAFRRYLGTVRDYRKNIYDFPAADLAKVREHWGYFIDKWGYAPPGSEE